uniref:Uncharacterized protein n=2 Tax=Picea TaxID=3328 RepID=A0A101LXS7_PICGL|nr:hypothetical protein ABT39_MTgene5514 [Picea glauca]QHR91580.1 hypothetical protein Q903MT_gene5615 [Picea sitchensis]
MLFLCHKRSDNPLIPNMPLMQLMPIIPLMPPFRVYMLTQIKTKALPCL